VPASEHTSPVFGLYLKQKLSLKYLKPRLLEWILDAVKELESTREVTMKGWKNGLTKYSDPFNEEDREKTKKFIESNPSFLVWWVPGFRGQKRDNIQAPINLLTATRAEILKRREKQFSEKDLFDEANEEKKEASMRAARTIDRATESSDDDEDDDFNYMDEESYGNNEETETNIAVTNTLLDNLRMNCEARGTRSRRRTDHGPMITQPDSEEEGEQY
jgi:hypothetical protein